MGTFSFDFLVVNHSQRHKRAQVTAALIDTGSEHTWVSEPTLRAIGVEPEKEEYVFQLADGHHVMRKIGFAIIKMGDRFTTDEVVFAQPGDFELIGARTLEGLNLIVDPRGKRLLPGPPPPAMRVVSASA